MAEGQRQVSAGFLALLVKLLSGVTTGAVPMAPYSLGMMGNMLGAGAPFGANSLTGASFKNGASIGFGGLEGAAAFPHQTHQTGADRLTASHRRLVTPDGFLKEGMHITIKPAGHNNEPPGPPYGGFHGLGHGRWSGGPLTAWGQGSFGAGFQGTLGGGLPGFGLPVSEQLEASIDIILPEGTPPFQRYLVFLEYVDPGLPNTEDQCRPEKQGAVLTGPVTQEQALHGFGSAYGFGGPSSLLGGNGFFGGHPTEPEFGVISTLTLQGGANSFELKGLGPFTRLNQLPGRGIAFCADLNIGANERSICEDIDGELADITFCASLGYSNGDDTKDLPSDD